MSEKQYFKVEYDEEWYLFDSTRISEQLVKEQAEYGYGVFANSLSPSEICDLLNELSDKNRQLKEENEFLKMENDKVDTETLLKLLVCIATSNRGWTDEERWFIKLLERELFPDE